MMFLFISLRKKIHMSRIGSYFVRVFSFFRKEMAEMIRQPRLVLTLIFGPFLILLLFGIGYRDQARSVRTLFVAAEDNVLRENIEEFATGLGEHLEYVGITADAEEAVNLLATGRVDMIVVPPADVEILLRQNEQAVFTLYHNEIDPAQVSYVEYLGRNYIDEVNRRVLSQYAGEAQAETTEITPDIRTARENARLMREALEAGNASAARGYQSDLNQNIGQMAGSLESRVLFARILQSETGTTTGGSDLENMVGLLAALQASEAVDAPIEDNRQNYDVEIARLSETEQQLAELEEQLIEFQSISPAILVSPFRSETRAITPLAQIDPAIFYAPAVIALLLQHIAVTFGALSIVRERLSGTMELFRISPISAGEAMLGKYISYMVMGSILAAILSALLYFVLGVPFLGGWQNVAIVTLVLLFASLGLGFVISLLAQNESQAVQLAMISLLVSVFFSGMFLDLRYLWEPVRIVSWMVPATYGTLLYQNIMLRGLGINLLYIGSLLAIGLVLLILGWLLLAREMRHE
jgi:ABC-2 type transport system permease protein